MCLPSGSFRIVLTERKRKKKRYPCLELNIGTSLNNYRLLNTCGTIQAFVFLEKNSQEEKQIFIYCPILFSKKYLELLEESHFCKGWVGKGTSYPASE